MVKRTIRITKIKGYRKKSNIEIYNDKINKLKKMDPDILKGNARSYFA